MRRPRRNLIWNNLKFNMFISNSMFTGISAVSDILWDRHTECSTIWNVCTWIPEESGKRLWTMEPDCKKILLFDEESNS
jgi:hypothetical protein